MSRDLEQEYFSDGITEDIIADLSKVSGLFVIARNSAFVYKDQAVNVPQVCRALGVRFALEGSIRKSGNRVRVTAQLIDGGDPVSSVAAQRALRRTICSSRAAS
jgi:adenylate cyclase